MAVFFRTTSWSPPGHRRKCREPFFFLKKSIFCASVVDSHPPSVFMAFHVRKMTIVRRPEVEQKCGEGVLECGQKDFQKPFSLNRFQLTEYISSYEFLVNT